MYMMMMVLNIYRYCARYLAVIQYHWLLPMTQFAVFAIRPVESWREGFV